jgi:DNA-binding transcriptional LysR family regulator
MDTSAINPARIDFVTLRLFCAVAQSSSITKGAVRCHLALSAASRRLADLEAATGSPLFERSAHGVSLTPAGHVAMQHAVRLCRGFELFGAEMTEYSEGYRGHVRLWANMSALTEFLPELLSEFMHKHSHIKIEAEEQLSGDIARALVEGMADIGVMAEGTPSHSLKVVPFQTDELVVVCVRTHPLAKHRRIDFRSCLAHPFVGLNQGSSLLELISNEARHAGLPLRLRIQVRSFGAMCRMIGANLGIGVLPRAAAQPLLAPYALKAIALQDSWARRRLVLACSGATPLSAAAELLWSHLSQCESSAFRKAAAKS